MGARYRVPGYHAALSAFENALRISGYAVFTDLYNERELIFMKRIKAVIRRFFKTCSCEKAALAHSKEIREAIRRKEEVMYWILDIARYSPLNK